MKFSVVAAALCAVTLAAPVSAQSCKSITTVPYAIWASGSYCVANDLNYAGNGTAIDIRNNHVILDLGGFHLRITGANTATGISNTLPTRDTIIRNGHIDGFQNGLFLDNVQNLTVENIVIDDAQQEGADINGVDVLLRNVTVRGVVGSSVGVNALGAQWEMDRVHVGGSFGWGLIDSVSRSWIHDSDLAGQTYAIGMYNPSHTLQNNQLWTTGNGTNVAVCGVTCTGIISGNTLGGATTNALNIMGSAKYRNNTAQGNLAYVGGTDGGGNQ